YPAGTFLPSEPALVHLYGASRETIRKALNELIDACLIQKIKGKGSMVLDISRFAFPVSDITTFSELNNRQQMHATTQVLNLEDRNLPTKIVEELTLQDKAAIFIRRLRSIDSDPIVIDEDYVLKKYVPTLTSAQAQNSLYSYFEKDLGLQIAYATKTITVESAPLAVTQQLHLHEADLVVFVRSLTYLK
ncbi:UTRA domain-containing protein, partial [Lactobacillus sp. XV13L]|nr:UTRA domain-containing protein [Lactobacillus sp. XV13L]